MEPQIGDHILIRDTYAKRHFYDRIIGRGAEIKSALKDHRDHTFYYVELLETTPSGERCLTGERWCIRAEDAQLLHQTNEKFISLLQKEL